MPFRIVCAQINTTTILQPSVHALLFAPCIPARRRRRNLTFFYTPRVILQIKGMVYQAQDNLPKLARAIFAGCLALLLIFESSGCRRKSAAAREATITIYGFSVVKEGLETSILPEYQREWEKKTRQQLTFETSYAGSEIVTNLIVAGAEADVAILAIERNADRLVRPEVTRNEWRKLPYGGIVNKTPMVIVVRRGNPKSIRDFGDLASLAWG